MTAPILIAGSGVGGLTFALSLHERGMACEVFEAAREVKPLGVGINTLPHAIRELAALGLLPALDAVAIRTRELRYLDRFGNRIWTEARGMHAGHDVPQFSIHRGRLHGVLWQAAMERLGPKAMHTGKRLAGFTQDAGGVTASFEDGGARRGKALVGADGIHSVLRGLLHPRDGGIRWNGIQMWRGALYWPAYEGGDVMIVAGDVREKFVPYPIAPGATPGMRLTGWVVCAQVGDASRRRRGARPGRARSPRRRPSSAPGRTCR